MDQGASACTVTSNLLPVVFGSWRPVSPREMKVQHSYCFQSTARRRHGLEHPNSKPRPGLRLRPARSALHKRKPVPAGSVGLTYYV